MHSHIGYIYSTFLHCVFLNVSSNGLSEKRHSHIVCICSTFVHGAFSNVSSNGLNEKMHSHIDCISLTFLHCAFSNVVGGLCQGAQATTAVTGFTSTFLHCVVRCGPAFVAAGCDTTAVTEFTWIMETDGRQPGGLATL